jgi:peptidoglycan/LPS O-acetylase OafA/YrhL
VAVLLVVAYHANLHVPGGFTGVDVFFAISGFVITGLLLPELMASGSIDLRRFYVRRARRLLPALAVMVAVVEIVGLLAGPMESQAIGAHTAIAAMLFSANVYLYHLGTGYFDVGSALNPLLHTWTLAVEEQFYLVFPALLLVIWRLSPRRPRAAALLVLTPLCLVSFALAVALSGTTAAFGSNQRFSFYGSPTRAWEFGAGVVVALLAPRLPNVRTAAHDLLGVAGLVAICLGMFLIEGTTRFPGWPTLLPVGGACAVLVAGTAQRSLAARLLSVRPMTWIGDRSYSWYLWHFPFLVFARAVFPGRPVAGAAAALSLVPAWLSYRYVENPIRFNPRLAGPRLVALALVCIAVPIAAAGAVIRMQGVLARSPAIALWSHKDVDYAAGVHHCETTVPIGARAGPRWTGCTWKAPPARGSIVLVGDSNGSQFSGPVVRAGNEAGYDVTVATLSGCPFVALRVVGTSVGESDCWRFDTESLAALVDLQPSLVVVANRDDRLIETSSKGFRATPGGPVIHDVRGKGRLWALGLTGLLQPLSRAGIPVLLVRPVPPVPSLPAGCAVIRVLMNDCQGSVSRGEVAVALRSAIAAESRAVAAAPSTVLVDFENELCGPVRCSTVRNGTVLFRDSDHLSVDGSLTLVEAFYRAIVQHARR